MFNLIKWAANLIRKWAANLTDKTVQTKLTEVNQASNHIDKLNRQIEAAQKTAASRIESIDVRRRELLRLREEFNDDIDELVVEIDDLRRDLKEHQLLLRTSQDDAKLLREVTIPGLMHDLSMFTERWKAESRIQTARVNITEQSNAKHSG